MATEKTRNPQTRLRGERFADKITTRLWQEIPSPGNPYIARSSRCHGYQLSELIEKRSYADVVFLLFKGELPTAKQSRLLESLMIGLINPGPRHPATRSAISAAVSKTHPEHLLPIALSVLSGAHLGAAEVSQAMRFISKNMGVPPGDAAKRLLRTEEKAGQGDWHIAPGFGSRFGGEDLLTADLAEALCRHADEEGPLLWARAFVECLPPCSMGWLPTGLAAAVFCDLGFSHRSGPGLFQLISAPGLLAHGLEFANKPITSVPFIDNDHYVMNMKQRPRSG